MQSRSGKRLMGAACSLAILAMTGSAFAQSAAERAVEAARQYAGETLNITWEAGLQAFDPLEHSGPIWEKLTGVKINVIAIPINELFTKTIAEHRSGTGAYDMLNVVPAWMPDMIEAGVLEPLDAYVDKHEYREELQDIAPAYRDNQMTYGNQIYGLPDDGDVFLLYYRTDLFGDPDNQAAFREAYGYDLAPPKTWDEFYDISKFFTDTGDGELYGSALILSPGLVHYLYEMRLRTAGGTFFDPDTMDAQINSDIAVTVLDDMVRQLDNMPPGAMGWGPIEVLNSWLAGQLAMQIWWPPPGRWSEGYNLKTDAFSWPPRIDHRRQCGLCAAARRASRTRGRLRPLRVVEFQEQGTRLSVRPVAQQPGLQHHPRDAAVCGTRPVPHLPLQQRQVQVAVACGQGLPCHSRGRSGDGTARSVDHRHLRL